MNTRNSGGVLLALALALSSCGKSGGPGQTLQRIAVTPGSPVIELDLGAPGAQAFVATGTYADGATEDLSARVAWAVENPAVGTMTGASLAIPAFAAAAVEVSGVTATLGGVVGEARVTVAAYRRSGPTQDLFFVLPYQDPAGAQQRPLEFSTAIPALDVFFLMDTTGSMFGSITNLQAALTSVVVPGIRAEVPDARFGAGAFEDFPVLPFGSLHGSDCGRGGSTLPDQPFHLFQTITDDLPSLQAGVAAMRTATGPIGCGQDWPEAGIEALYQAATGEGLPGPAPTSVAANHAGVGGVAFREGAMPVIVQITDAQMHGPGETGTCPTTGEGAGYSGTVAPVAHGRAQAKAALAAICARVVGVAPIQVSLAAQCSGQADLEDFATATGALVPPAAWDAGTRPAGCAADQCCTDVNGAGRAADGQGLCPVVFRAASDGTGLGASIVTGLRMLTRFATFDVQAQAEGVTADVDDRPLPAGHTTAEFLEAISPASFQVPPAPPVLPDPTFDATAFHRVTPGTLVSFGVTARNDLVQQTDQPQVFRATIRVVGGGCTPLDVREVLVLVPPRPLAAP